MIRPSDWSAADKERLRALWAEGRSSLQIAEAMGRTKNSVVGQAHRMGLPSRPSPIRYGGAPRVVRERAPRKTRAPLPAAAATPPAPDMAPVEPPPRVVATGGPGCRFPLWGLKDKADHRYCDRPVQRRPDGTATSWCPACARRVYERKAVAA